MFVVIKSQILEFLLKKYNEILILSQLRDNLWWILSTAATYKENWKSHYFSFVCGKYIGSLYNKNKKN